MTIKIDKVEHPNIVQRYISGESTPEIAKTLGVNPLTIINILKKSNVKIRTYSEAARKYTLIEDFFDKIDTQEKAYFLGYLYADGCNSGKNVSLNLSEKDKEMLEKLNMLVHPNGKPLCKGHRRVSRFKGKETTCITKTNYHMVIENKHISDILTQHGCTPRKTATLEFPFNSVSKELIPHFIRGYFDGDGAISVYGKKDSFIQGYISIVSSSYFCDSLKDIVQDTLEIKSKIRKRDYADNKVVEFRITNTKHVIKFLEWIYSGSIIHLNRKYETFQKLLKNREHLSVDKVCCICAKEHYAKGYCSTHYQIYVRKVTALNRARKSLLDYLLLSKAQDADKQIIALVS
jgi:hypothetical protein